MYGAEYSLSAVLPVSLLAADKDVHHVRLSCRNRFTSIDDTNRQRVADISSLGFALLRCLRASAISGTITAVRLP